MNKQFKTFLSKKKQEWVHPNGLGCTHGLNKWCQNCVAKRQLTSVELPDGTISTGYIIINHDNSQHNHRRGEERSNINRVYNNQP